MKRVHVASSVWEAREILALLEQQQIPAIVLNEHLADTPGVLPFNPRMAIDAEVWVLDDQLAPRCARLITEFQAVAAPGPAWTCPGCREENPAGFEVCWACGRAR